MNPKPFKGWLKHADFIVIDLITLQLCFVLAYWIVVGIGNPYILNNYEYMAEVLLIGHFFAIVFSNNYKGILVRGRLDELVSVIKYAIVILMVALFFLFVVHQTIVVSRLQVGTTMVLFVIVDFFLRHLNKKRIFRKSSNRENKIGKSLVLITAGYLVDDAIEKLTDPEIYRNHFVSEIVLIDSDFSAVDNKYDIPMHPLSDNTIQYIRSEWVDEVFILQPDNYNVDKNLMDDLIDMGLTVHICPEILNHESGTVVEMRKLGKFKVLTSSINSVPADKLFVKRVFDIVGGFIGCICTCVMFIFIAPAIYIKSPGPIFFKQERIGRNGRLFYMYKFRSMYLDAEERKKDLIDKNETDDDYMFKIEDDPRIIGSEKKGKNGKPKGIGNFIRKTSLDEFPQFWNVLNGTMSLVGTRPPLVSEWNMYDLHHRARMTVKPGITGLWQVSGRNEIKDFEEVVRLDREYIESWSLLLDFKIILKTIGVIILRKGAS